MIKEMKALTLVEAQDIATANEGDGEVMDYFKKFIKLKPKEAKELKEELIKLNNHKIKEEHIVKIVDFLPSDGSDLNNIFNDISIEENEIKQLLDIVSKYR